MSKKGVGCPRCGFVVMFNDLENWDNVPLDLSILFSYLYTTSSQKTLSSCFKNSNMSALKYATIFVYNYDLFAVYFKTPFVEISNMVNRFFKLSLDAFKDF